MRAITASAALCASLFTLTYAGNPAFPVSSEGYQSIFLGISSLDPLFLNKSISAMNDDLSMIAMGNTGLTSALTNGPGPFGWHEERGVIAQKRTLPGNSLNWQDREYEWVDLQFRVQTDHWGGPETLPWNGLAAPYFPPYDYRGTGKRRNDKIQGPSFDPPRFVANAEGYIGIKGGNGEFVDCWYACDDGKMGSALSWSLDDTGANDAACVLVHLRKVNNRMGLTPTTPTEPGSTPQPGNPLPLPSSPHGPKPSMTGNDFRPLPQAINNSAFALRPSFFSAFVLIVATAFMCAIWA